MVLDCFPFLNEHDLLEIRLHELDPVVDKFVIVEATRTFSNKHKKLVYPEQEKRHAKFAHKIRYVVMDDYTGIDTSDAWALEHAQKQVGLDVALDMASHGDLLIYADCDEIPKADAVRKAASMPFHMATLEMPMFYYSLNCRCVNKTWKLCKIVRLNGTKLRHRQIRRRKGDAVIRDAGWHFSYLGEDTIKYKIDSFAHTEYAKPPYNTVEHIREKVSRGEDLFGRNMSFAKQRDIDYLPQHVLNNMDRFGKYLS